MERELFSYMRTTQGLRYERFMASMRALSLSGDPKSKELVKRAKDSILRVKTLSPGTVHNDSTLSNVSIQYANDDYIGERIMPIVPVAKLSDTYFKYDKRERLAAPDDALGARGDANELEAARSTDNYSCKGYGYTGYVDQETLDNQDAPLDEMVDLVESQVEAMALRREMRIAAIATNPANFAGNTTAIAPGVRWDTAIGGDPIKNIQDALAAMWTGRGPGEKVAFCSLDVWNVLARHPRILDLFKYNSSGLTTPDQFARFFGIARLLVAESRKDTANEGQTEVYARIWSNVFGIVRVATRPSIRNAAFGNTFRHKGRVNTNQWYDPSKGIAGGYCNKTTVSEDHKVVAADTAYLITTPIS